jgi:hypothetical protein
MRKTYLDLYRAVAAKVARDDLPMALKTSQDVIDRAIERLRGADILQLVGRLYGSGGAAVEVDGDNAADEPAARLQAAAHGIDLDEPIAG